MNLTVREVDPRQEREKLVHILTQYLGPDADESRFDWLYLANPHGTARAWVLETNNVLVGAGATIPRRLQMFGSSTPGSIFSDFCVSPNFRTIGPALQLQRACLQAVDSGWAQLAYDLPSASMMAVYKRLGMQSRAMLVRMAKPLRVDRQIQGRIRSGVVSNLLIGTGNTFLKLRDRARLGTHELEPRKFEESFDEELAELIARSSPVSQSWRVERSVPYLNWRFRDYPKKRYSQWIARREGRLEGFVAAEKRGLDVWIAEMLVSDAPGILESMISFLSEHARAEGAAALNFPSLDEHVWSKRLHALGFRPRESSPIVVYAAKSEAIPPSWLTEGDRDS